MASLSPATAETRAARHDRVFTADEWISANDPRFRKAVRRARAGTRLADRGVSIPAGQRRELRRRGLVKPSASRPVTTSIQLPGSGTGVTSPSVTVARPGQRHDAGFETFIGTELETRRFRSFLASVPDRLCTS